MRNFGKEYLGAMIRLKTGHEWSVIDGLRQLSKANQEKQQLFKAKDSEELSKADSYIQDKHEAS